MLQFDKVACFKIEFVIFKNVMKCTNQNLVRIDLRGYYTSYQKLACFVLYLNIMNNFLKNKVCIYNKTLFKELKNGIEMLVGQAFFKLQIKTPTMLVLGQ